MTDNPNDNTDPGGTDGGDDTDDAPITMGTIRSVISEMLNKNTATRTAGRSAVNSRLTRDTEIADAVESAVKQLKADEDKHRKDKDLHDTVQSIKAKVDKAPKEYRKITRIMFGSDD